VSSAPVVTAFTTTTGFLTLLIECRVTPIQSTAALMTAGSLPFFACAATFSWAAKYAWACFWTKGITPRSQGESFSNLSRLQATVKVNNRTVCKGFAVLLSACDYRNFSFSFKHKLQRHVNNCNALHRDETKDFENVHF
jgi:hypothetical protein